MKKTSYIALDPNMSSRRYAMSLIVVSHIFYNITFFITNLPTRSLSKNLWK